ncbi:MAG: tRNA pseudouridine(38-40) synthase TruA [bacterium]|nr:tRNA pseudouridine(38-40) synthase TruA [bacterium]
MNIKLIIEYDGTNFNGWQMQLGPRSIQETLQEAVYKLTKEIVTVHGSGRTDAQVHALGQVANFQTEANIPPTKWAHALNSVLPVDVKIKKSEEVSDTFHARFSAKSKTYNYLIYLDPMPSPIYRNKVWQVYAPLNMDLMAAAVQSLQGTHDFQAFCATGRTVKSTVRTVYDARIEKRESIYSFTITADGFLYNMVRIIVGALVAVGHEKLPANVFQKAIATGDRGELDITAPPHGLYLVEVCY